MLRKKDIARIIHDKYKLRNGYQIPLYLAEWMIDYVFEALKLGLIEDGVVDLVGYGTFQRVDVPEHTKRLPNDSYTTISAKSKVRTKWKPQFLKDVTNGEIKEKCNARRKKFR